MPGFCHTELEPATPERLNIGRGEPSGKDGRWRVCEIETDAPLLIYGVAGRLAEVRSAQDWRECRSDGILVVSALGGVAKSFDEYRYFGADPKFGLYVADEIFETVLAQARSELS